MLLSSKLRILTDAPGATACVVSCTTPTMLPNVDCAWAETLIPMRDRTIMAAAILECAILGWTTALVTSLTSTGTMLRRSNLPIVFGVHAQCFEPSRDGI